MSRGQKVALWIVTVKQASDSTRVSTAIALQERCSPPRVAPEKAVFLHAYLFAAGNTYKHGEYRIVAL